MDREDFAYDYCYVHDSEKSLTLPSMLGPIVQILSEDQPDDVETNVHAELLHRYVHRLIEGHDITKPIQLEVPFDGLRHFAHWLYCGKAVYPHVWDRHQNWMDDLDELLAAHTTGRRLDCVDFMDAVIEYFVEESDNFVVFEDFTAAFTEEFSVGSGGRQLAVVFLVYEIA